MFLNTDFLKNDEIWLRLDKVSEGNPVRNWVPAYYFTIMNHAGEEMGTCDLRIGHNELTYYGGNIGYGVKEEYRGHHYAAKACLLLFELARKHELEYVYITCNVTNQASAKTCEYAGGTLVAVEDLPEDNDMYQEGMRQVKVYRFEL